MTRYKFTKSEKYHSRLKRKNRPMKVRPYSNTNGGLISCIIYTYNRATILPRAIKSVLNQTYKDFELIIVDDCSTDNTQDIVLSFYDDRIRYWKNDINLGSSKNKNVGISKAIGDYIVILDDDNEFMPTFFEETLEFLRNSPSEVGGIRVGRLIIRDGYRDYAPVRTGLFESIDWGFMMKKEVFDELSYDPLCRGDEDADFGIQFAKRWRSVYIEKPLLICYANDEGSNCTPTPQRLAGLEYFIKKNLDYYKQDKNELRYLYRLAGRNFYKAGQRLKGIKYFWLSFLAKKNFKTFLHLFFILFGWRVYNFYMDSQERKAAKERLQRYGIS
jgi:glycosyltransferase involved in cell wall biosynthesis